MKTDSTVTKGKAKAKKIADPKNSSSKGNAVKSALSMISAKIDNAVITAYKQLNESLITECTQKYIQFMKEIIILKPKNINFLELGSLSQIDYEKQVKALPKNYLQIYTSAVLLCIKISISFDKVSSTALQALFTELSGIRISGIKKFSESMLHFGLHSNCKYKTGEVIPKEKHNTEHDIDKVALQTFEVYPLAIKGGKISTKTENGFYYPIPALASLYCVVANSLSAEKIKFLFTYFYEQRVSEKEKDQIKNFVK